MSIHFYAIAAQPAINGDGNISEESIHVLLKYAQALSAREGIKKNEAEAVRLFKIAANFGDKVAMYRFGHILPSRYRCRKKCGRICQIS